MSAYLHVPIATVPSRDAYGNVTGGYWRDTDYGYKSGSRRVYMQFNKNTTRIGNVTRYRIWNRNNQVEQDRTDVWVGNWLLVYQTTDANNDASWHCCYFDVLLNNHWWKSNALYPSANATSSAIYIRE